MKNYVPGGPNTSKNMDRPVLILHNVTVAMVPSLKIGSTPDFPRVQILQVEKCGPPQYNSIKFVYIFIAKIINNKGIHAYN